VRLKLAAKIKSAMPAVCGIAFGRIAATYLSLHKMENPGEAGFLRFRCVKRRSPEHSCSYGPELSFVIRIRSADSGLRFPPQLAAITSAALCLSMRDIRRAYQNGSVRLDTAGEIFTSCDVFNGLMIFAEHFELVPSVAVEMVFECLTADRASYPLCLETPFPGHFDPRGYATCGFSKTSGGCRHSLCGN
jgi:hypothetical protein